MPRFISRGSASPVGENNGGALPPLLSPHRGSLAQQPINSSNLIRQFGQALIPSAFDRHAKKMVYHLNESTLWFRAVASWFVRRSEL
jgi:hypothetical protein